MPEAIVPAEGVKVEVGRAADGRRRVSVCAGTACVFAGSMKIKDEFEAQIAAAGLQDQASVSIIGCHGLCSQGPLAVVSDGDTYYPRLKIKDVATVVTEHLAGGQVVEKLLYTDPATGERIACAHDIPFYKAQRRIALRDVGVIDPESIDEYLARGGYEAARTALTTMKPAEIVEEMLASGLRGRGGAGFPTGMKWKFAAASPGDTKYIICNGDEGDPGAFMDRSVMEGDPHRVLEGMIIGAYAIGAHEGYIYVRAEYPLAVKRLRMAIAAGGGARLAGRRHPRQRASTSDLQDQGGRRRLRLRRGDGADRLDRGQARHAAHAGRRSRRRAACGASRPSSTTSRPGPTCPGSSPTARSWFAAIGTEKSKGTKIFPWPARSTTRAWSRCRWASTLREIIFDIGGGITGRQEVQGGADRRALRRLPPGDRSWTCRSTTRAWPPPAPSWAPAAWW